MELKKNAFALYHNNGPLSVLQRLVKNPANQRQLVGGWHVSYLSGYQKQIHPMAGGTVRITDPAPFTTGYSAWPPPRECENSRPSSIPALSGVSREKYHGVSLHMFEVSVRKYSAPH